MSRHVSGTENIMPARVENAVALWFWPLRAARLGTDVAETMMGAQRVISARMPTISDAMRKPLAPDHAELGLMVSEKVEAFDRSGKSMVAAGGVICRAVVSNAKTLGGLAGGRMLWPNEWMRIAENNMAAAAALVTLPAAALAPIHREVVANDRRLSR